MRIIFFRHGETEFNISDRFQGVADSPLTENGVEQAKKINTVLRSEFNVQKFFISPAPRVFQTYEYASKNIQAEKIIEPRIQECSYGEWEGKERSEIDSQLLEKRSKDRYNFVHPGSYQGIKGESYKDVYIRLIPFLSELNNYPNLDYDIAVICHNGVMMLIEEYYIDLSDEVLNTIRVKNSSYFIWDKSNKKFSIKSL